MKLKKLNRIINYVIWLGAMWFDNNSKCWKSCTLCLSLKKQLSLIQCIKSFLNILSLKRLSRSPLVLIILLLLPYSFNTKALTSSTVQIIYGHAPYLTFDNGITKVDTTDSLLSIKLSDGTIFTPNNTSATTPIMLPDKNDTLANVSMLVPTSTNSIGLNELIGAPYNYWGDDDGDGQGNSGIEAKGSLSLSITDKYNNSANRNATLDICNAPYKVVLTSTDGNLTTQYGMPNSSTFRSKSAIYYINPKSQPIICYAKPILKYGSDNYAGAPNIWNPSKGFLLQSTTSSSYSDNFPTTGANNLYFDLEIGSSSGPLTWPSVKSEDSLITVTMTSVPDRRDDGTSIRVTFTGPVARADKINSNSPGLINRPTLPQQFELVGYDSSNKVIVKYGFVLKQWFINRGTKTADFSEAESWCASLGYRLPHVRDLTNAVCVGSWAGSWCQGAVGALPPSSGNHYQRRIGAGFFTEWGYMAMYPAGGFDWRSYWTSDTIGNSHFVVDEDDADVYDATSKDVVKTKVVCAYP